MSADLLARAAAKLREHAEAVEPGPWDAADDGLVWPNCIGDPVSGSVLIEDARYIALMHPPVALALAVWLEQQARHVADAVAAWSRDPGYINAHLGGVDAHTANMFALPFEVARAILREPAGGAT